MGLLPLPLLLLSSLLPRRRWRDSHRPPVNSFKEDVRPPRRNFKNRYLMPSRIWTCGHPIKMRTPTVLEKRRSWELGHQGGKVVRARWLDGRTISRTTQEARNVEEG